MTETHERTLFVIEVAPNLFLTCYSQRGAYCASRNIFYKPRERFQDAETLFVENIDEILTQTPRLNSEEDCIKYIQKKGSMEDFLDWCKNLKKKYGGDGKPRIRKVTATLTAEIEEGKEIKL